MVSMVAGIFAALLVHYEDKWKAEEEENNWNFWEDCEMMREEMGHTTDIVKFPKKRHAPTRNKHR